MTNIYWPLPEPNSLGGIIGADDVRDAIKATILLWSPFYLMAISETLAAQNRIGGTSGGFKQPPNPLPQFGTWVNEPTHRNFGTGEPAAFLVTVPATVGVPDLQSSGQYIATWRAQVEVQVFGTSWEEAADLSSWYEKVVRWCILQHRSLGGLAMTTKWTGASYSGTQHTSTRTVGEVAMGFDVMVEDVADVNRGPQTVPSPLAIPAQDPTVKTVIPDLSKTADTAPLP